MSNDPSSMRLPIEIWRSILEEMLPSERKRQHDLTPNSSVAALARANTFFRDLAHEYLYKYIYLGPTTFRCMLGETLALFSRTMAENESLAGLVEEIHTGTIGGEPGEAFHLLRILQSVPNLRVFELRGWARVHISVMPIFEVLREKHHLRALILSPNRLLGSSSPPLCDVEDLVLILHHLHDLETVSIDSFTCCSRDDGSTHALYHTTSDLPSMRATISHDFASSMQRLRERRQIIISASPLQNWDSGLAQNTCPTIRRLTLINCLNSDYEFHMLSSLAPNLTELNAASSCTHLCDQPPTTFIAPALRVWSDQLVKLVLPEFRIKSNVIYPNNPDAQWASRFPFSEDDTIANIIVQMPRLRVLGIARGSISPKHFVRGPKSLMSLNLYLPSSSLLYNPSGHILPEIVAVLRNETTLPQLRHLCLTTERGGPNTSLLEDVVNMRGIVLHDRPKQWESASQELCGLSD
ncbi:uncharacterized protein STEHIDRAFT_114629 [Stereum hirsutum FP-91666 SS1]|uniref:uncharacterized protein n=1 Tax=Stereum hirsutum (strain FP-91666) TaxID=721885 RepID=UPI000444A042|nr:uncharacterized protein STEHIDRAFT_114629 [Stereum hirsutum FP-91666 SS1]EIM81946.1 hypothetical protein STEHIDRAFT_114629 [Stereum hirsutum FP-91666 SS1]